jgi:hypothetical protein
MVRLRRASAGASPPENFELRRSLPLFRSPVALIINHANIPPQSIQRKRFVAGWNTSHRSGRTLKCEINDARKIRRSNPIPARLCCGAWTLPVRTCARRGSKLVGTDLRSADLFGADLQDVIRLTNVQIHGAASDQHTSLEDHTLSPFGEPSGKKLRRHFLPADACFL